MVTTVSEAPFNDINLIRTINTHKSYNKTISETHLSKCLNYLWYIKEECMVFDIFYKIVPLEIRKIMADKLIEYKELMKLTTGIKKKMYWDRNISLKIRIYRCIFK